MLNYSINLFCMNTIHFQLQTETDINYITGMNTVLKMYEL